jgi:hypothetical protein
MLDDYRPSHVRDFLSTDQVFFLVAIASLRYPYFNMCGRNKPLPITQLIISLLGRVSKCRIERRIIAAILKLNYVESCLFGNRYESSVVGSYV